MKNIQQHKMRKHLFLCKILSFNIYKKVIKNFFQWLFLLNSVYYATVPLTILWVYVGWLCVDSFALCVRHNPHVHRAVTSAVFTIFCIPHTTSLLQFLCVHMLNRLENKRHMAHVLDYHKKAQWTLLEQKFRQP